MIFYLDLILLDFLRFTKLFSFSNSTHRLIVSRRQFRVLIFNRLCFKKLQFFAFKFLSLSPEQKEFCSKSFRIKTRSIWTMRFSTEGDEFWFCTFSLFQFAWKLKKKRKHVWMFIPVNYQKKKKKNGDKEKSSTNLLLSLSFFFIFCQTI